MIISKEHRYLFIEIPLTASWAIHHELVNYYGGTPILHKHASYPEFKRIARGDEKEYFVFAAVRNPLDAVVSRYFKLITDHKGAFGDPKASKNLQIDKSDSAKYQYVRQEGVTFADYFFRFHKRPFNTQIDLSASHLDYVIRYERLQGDFAQVLEHLNLKQVRPIPVVNKTQSRSSDWKAYYTPEIVEQSKRIFAPYMKKWGYQFPDEWGNYDMAWMDGARFRFWASLQRFYLVNFRYNDRALGRIVRLIRARL